MNLIDRDELLKKAIKEKRFVFRMEDLLNEEVIIETVYEDLARFILFTPTIEAEPVRHGRWERTSDGAAYCTACKRKMNPSQYGYGFCSMCGAKMDLK